MLRSSALFCVASPCCHNLDRQEGLLTCNQIKKTQFVCIEYLQVLKSKRVQNIQTTSRGWICSSLSASSRHRPVLHQSLLHDKMFLAATKTSQTTAREYLLITIFEKMKKANVPPDSTRPVKELAQKCSSLSAKTFRVRIRVKMEATLPFEIQLLASHSNTGTVIRVLLESGAGCALRIFGRQIL